MPAGIKINPYGTGMPAGILLISRAAPSFACSVPSLACSLAPPTPRAYHVWTARGVQVARARSALVRMRSCVRPLTQDQSRCPPTAFHRLRRRNLCCLRPDGIRERPPNSQAACDGHWYARIVSLVGSTDSHLLLALKPSAAARGSGGDRLAPIRFPARHYPLRQLSPNNPGD